MANWLPLGTTQAGIDEWFSYDEMTDTAIVKSHQDLEPAIEANKAAQNDGTNGFTQSRDMRKVASVPSFVAQMWSAKHGLPGMDIMKKEYRPLLQRELKDPDNRFFLTGSRNFDIVKN